MLALLAQATEESSSSGNPLPILLLGVVLGLLGAWLVWYLRRPSASVPAPTPPTIGSYNPDWFQFAEPAMRAGQLFIGNLAYPSMKSARAGPTAIRMTAAEKPLPTGSITIAPEHLFLHCHILGGTGSGKTSSGILSMALQLMEMTDVMPDTQQRPAFVFLDMKGDDALFHSLKQHARSRRFSFFTPEDRASYYFDPYDEARRGTTVAQFASLILDSLGLNHGEGYGRSYYSRQSRSALQHALTRKPSPTTFDELLKELRRVPKEYARDARELVTVISSLTLYDRLLTNAQRRAQVHPDSVIQFDRVLQQGDVAYFWLPAGRESASVREIGKLAIYCIVNALKRLNPIAPSAASTSENRRDTRPRQTVYVFIDEFQCLVGENIQSILSQGRSQGLRVILANQALSQLTFSDWNFARTIPGIVGTQLHFRTLEDDQLKRLSSLSGTVHDTYVSVSLGSRRLSPSFSEPKSRPTLRMHDVQELLSKPGGAVFYAGTMFSGLAVPCQTIHPIAKTIYDQNDRTSWPSSDEIPGGAPPPLAHSHERIVAAVDKARDHQFNATIDTFFEPHVSPGEPARSLSRPAGQKRVPSVDRDSRRRPPRKENP